MRLVVVLGLALLTTACAADRDTDEDGILDKDEETLGTDPESDDSDGDGLTDGYELEIGSDPLVVDSDGDGYDDALEVELGTDPADASSMVYLGGWPHNPDKDDIVDPGFQNGGGVAGSTFARFIGSDQFKDDVDIYDFANQGTPVIIDVSAEWCPPCQAMSSWLSGDTSSADFTYFENQWGDVRAAVDSGAIRWITILGERNNGSPAGPNTPVRWDESYPNHNVPVLADSDYVMVSYIGLRGWPSAMLLNEDMTIDVYNANNWTTALNAAQNLIDSGQVVLPQ